MTLLEVCDKIDVMVGKNIHFRMITEEEGEQDDSNSVEKG